MAAPYLAGPPPVVGETWIEAKAADGKVLFRVYLELDLPTDFANFGVKIFLSTSWVQ